MIKKTVKAIGISLAVLAVMVAGVFVYQATASAAEERSYASNNGSNESVIDEVNVTDTEEKQEETTVTEETTEAQTEETTNTGIGTQPSGGQTNVASTPATTTTAATQAATVSSAPQAGVPLTDAQGRALASQNSSTYSAKINEMYSIINQRRAENGLAALALDGSLIQVASFRAAEMAHLDNGTSQVSHTRPNGTSFSTVAKNVYGIGYSVIGENICDVISSASGAMTAFMNSPGHKANILGNYTKVGIGVAQASDGTYYWVQIFTL